MKTAQVEEALLWCLFANVCPCTVHVLLSITVWIFTLWIFIYLPVYFVAFVCNTEEKANVQCYLYDIYMIVDFSTYHQQK